MPHIGSFPLCLYLPPALACESALPHGCPRTELFYPRSLFIFLSGLSLVLLFSQLLWSARHLTVKTHTSKVRFARGLDLSLWLPFQGNDVAEGGASKERPVTVWRSSCSVYTRAAELWREGCLWCGTSACDHSPDSCQRLGFNWRKPEWMKETISNAAGPSLFPVGGRSRQGFRMGLYSKAIPRLSIASKSLISPSGTSLWHSVRVCSYPAAFSHFRVPGETRPWHWLALNASAGMRLRNLYYIQIHAM